MGKPTVYNVSVTIGGSNYSAIRVQLQLGLSAIPKIIVTVAPFKSKVVSKPDLMAYCSANLSKLEQALKAGQTGTVTIESSEEGTAVISGWYVTNVGLSINNPTVPSGINVTLSHPAVELSRIYLGSFGALRPPTTDKGKIKGGTFLNSVTKCIGKYVDFLRDAEADASNDYFSKLADMLETASNSIKKHLKCDVGKPKIPEGFTDAAYDWLWDSLLSEVNTNVWSWLVQVCTQYGLIIRPDLSDINQPLHIVPIEPWGDVHYGLDDRKIQQVFMPGVDIWDYSGFITTINDKNVNNPNFTIVNASKGLKTSANKVFVYPKNIDVKYGTYLYRCEIPQWVYKALDTGAGGGKNFKIFDARDAANNSAGVGNVGFGGDRTITHNLISEKDAEIFLQYTAQAVHRQSRHVNLVSNLLLFGKVAVPGTVFAIKSSGTTVFYFYSNKIKHELDVMSKNVSTVVDGTHFRGPQGGRFSVTPAKGSKNKLYN